MLAVTLHRLVSAASTLVVAIVLAICVPVSQLRTATHETECCCPDPDQCKCPDHQPDKSTQSKMRACHKTTQSFVAPVSPAFVPPQIVLAARPEVVAITAAFSLPAPHPSPLPRRPDAPS